MENTIVKRPKPIGLNTIKQAIKERIRMGEEAQFRLLDFLEDNQMEWRKSQIYAQKIGGKKKVEEKLAKFS